MSSLTTKPTTSWVYNNSGYPSCLRLTTLPEQPLTKPPTADHLIISPRAASLNPVDVQIMNLAVWGLPLPFSPFNKQDKGLAQDFAGTVLAPGEKSGLSEGDEVFGITLPPIMGTGANTGVLSEGAVSLFLPKTVIVKKPKDWSWEKAAALPLVWLTARTIVEAVATEPRIKDRGEKKRIVVLGGSSSTGMYMVHQARARGWTVLSSCSGKNIDFVKSMGADEVVDYTQEKVPEEVRKFKPDAILDCVGGTECLGLAPYYITIVGDKTSRVNMGGAMTYLWNPQMVARWAWGKYGFGHRYDCLNIDFRKEWLEETLNMDKEKIIVDSVYPFEQAKEAFERMNTGRARGKVVVKMSE